MDAGKGETRERECLAHRGRKESEKAQRRNGLREGVSRSRMRGQGMRTRVVCNLSPALHPYRNYEQFGTARPIGS